MMFLHCNYHKFFGHFLMGRHSEIDHILIEDGTQVYMMCDRPGQQIVILTTTWWWQSLGKDWQ
jgi:hypothetical protein